MVGGRTEVHLWVGLWKEADLVVIHVVASHVVVIHVVASHVAAPHVAAPHVVEHLHVEVVTAAKRLVVLGTEVVAKVAVRLAEQFCLLQVEVHVARPDHLYLVAGPVGDRVEDPVEDRVGHPEEDSRKIFGVFLDVIHVVRLELWQMVVVPATLAPLSVLHHFLSFFQLPSCCANLNMYSSFAGIDGRLLWSKINIRENRSYQLFGQLNRTKRKDAAEKI